MFIVSLAIADLIVGLSVMPFSAIYIFTIDWLFGVSVCEIWITIDYIASTASILNLFILSLDRYWSVTSPLKYIRKRTKKRALVMISIAWFVSSLWILPTTGWHYFVREGIRIVPSDVCDTEYATNYVFKVVTAFFNFYLPLAVMYILYFNIFREIQKRSKFELGQRNPGGSYSNANAAPPVVSTADDSDQKNDTFDDVTPPSAAGEDAHAHQNADDEFDKDRVTLEVNYKKSTKKGYSNLRLIANHPECHLNNQTKHPVEYVYDENVLDPLTEKVERFYYEDNVLQNYKESDVIVNRRACAETSLSTASGSTSTSSEREKHQTHRHGNKKNTNYSLSSGIRKIREAEMLLNQTVTIANDRHGANKRKPRRESNLNFMFKDDANRRMSNVQNIRDRIKVFKQSSSLTKEIKAARQLGVIMGAFTLCFLPYFILFMVVAFCDGCVDPGLLTAMTWVGYLNSTLNPFLYPLCNANFRRKFRKMLRLGNIDRHRRKFEHGERNSLTTGRYD